VVNASFDVVKSIFFRKTHKELERLRQEVTVCAFLPYSLAILLGGGLWMLRPSPVSPPHLVRYLSDEYRRITDGKTADV